MSCEGVVGFSSSVGGSSQEAVFSYLRFLSESPREMRLERGKTRLERGTMSMMV
jgi:hypothetical protein